MHIFVNSQRLNYHDIRKIDELFNYKKDPIKIIYFNNEDLLGG